MAGEVVAALVVCAGGKSAAVIRRVEAQVFAADSRHDIAPKFLAELRAVYGIEVIENGPIGLGKGKVGHGAAVYRLPGAPGHFAAKSDVALEKKNPTEAGIESATE